MSSLLREIEHFDRRECGGADSGKVLHGGLNEFAKSTLTAKLSTVSRLPLPTAGEELLVTFQPEPTLTQETPTRTTIRTQVVYDSRCRHVNTVCA